MMTQSDKEKIRMMPTPRFVNAPLQWTIRKILTRNDVNPINCQLILPRKSFEDHIRSHLPEDIGIPVNVYDHDTGTLHHDMRLTFYSSYVLRGVNWREHFVVRRELKEGEEIGLLWDSSASRLKFSVISRYPA